MSKLYLKDIGKCKYLAQNGERYHKFMSRFPFVVHLDKYNFPVKQNVHGLATISVSDMYDALSDVERYGWKDRYGNMSNNLLLLDQMRGSPLMFTFNEPLEIGERYLWYT